MCNQSCSLISTHILNTFLILCPNDVAISRKGYCDCYLQCCKVTNFYLEKMNIVLLSCLSCVYTYIIIGFWYLWKCFLVTLKKLYYVVAAMLVFCDIWFCGVRLIYDQTIVIVLICLHPCFCPKRYWSHFVKNFGGFSSRSNAIYKRFNAFSSLTRNASLREKNSWNN